jgi:hypothetical protein
MCTNSNDPTFVVGYPANFSGATSQDVYEDDDTGYGVETFNRPGTWTQSATPMYACTGFQPPFNVSLSLKPKVQRAIPLKAQLFDTSNSVVTDTTIAGAAPVVNIAFTAVNSPAVDETSLLDAVGQSSSGNSFTYNATTQTWQYNMATTPFTAAGTYTVTVNSADATKYAVSPTCTGTFVRQ